MKRVTEGLSDFHHARVEAPDIFGAQENSRLIQAARDLSFDIIISNKTA